MCAERAVAYFEDNIEPKLASGKNIMIAAHGNSLLSIIMYLDKLTCQEVISLELSTGIPLLYIFKQGKFIKRGSRCLCLYKEIGSIQTEAGRERSSHLFLK